MIVEIRHLRQFLAVAEELHFTRAAESLHIAQPALSAQIKKLERSLQLQLFVRNTRAVELTPEGERFVDSARLAVESYDAAMLQAATLRSGEHGHVNCGVSPRFRPEFRRQIVRNVEQVNPRITLDFISESSVRLVEGVSEGRLQAAFCLAPTNTGNLRRVLIKNDPFLVALRRDHPLANSEVLVLSDLKNETWILPSERVYSSNSVLQQRCLDAGFTMNIAQEHSDHDDDFSLVAGGTGIEVVPSMFTRPRAEGDVIFIPLAGQTIPLYFIAPANADTPGLRALFVSLQHHSFGVESSHVSLE